MNISYEPFNGKERKTILMRRVIFSAIVMLSVYGGANFYIARSLYQGIILAFPHLNAFAFAGIYIFVALSIFFRFLPVPYGLKRFMNRIGTHWMGIFVFLLLLFLIADILILLGRVTTIIPSPLPSDIRFWSVLIVVLITTALMIYGKYNAAQIRHVFYDIQLKKSVLADEIKVVLIADLHLGYSTVEKDLPRIIQSINDLRPDIVCIAGDIFNDDIGLIRNPETIIDLFKSINTAYGVYACLGNHDAGRTLPEMQKFLEQSNIVLLNDEHITINDKFVLVGRLDLSPIGGFEGFIRAGIAELTASIDSELPVIVMDHSPAHLEEYSNEIDLLLSGHTHRGQFFPMNLITKRMFTVDYGYYQSDPDSPHAIVTSGVSTWGIPIRIGTNNEIVSITIR